MANSFLMPIEIEKKYRLTREGKGALRRRLGEAGELVCGEEVADADALAAILEALGYRPALVYEKRRETWRAAGAEVVLDELPFGLFVEIEGEEARILEVEKLLGLDRAEAEHAPYPELTLRHGTKRGDVVESRFCAALT